MPHYKQKVKDQNLKEEDQLTKNTRSLMDNMFDAMQKNSTLRSLTNMKRNGNTIDVTPKKKTKKKAK